jgi:hypothetical protein
VIRLLGGGLVLALALVLAAALAWQLVQDLALWDLGREVQADIVDRWVKQVGGQDEMNQWASGGSGDVNGWLATFPPGSAARGGEEGKRGE